MSGDTAPPPDWAVGAPFHLGAIHRPAPPRIPVLRASLPASLVQPPSECRWDLGLDLTGDDGLPDALGNDQIGNCVPCAALRQMQLWCGDGRKPTRHQADMLLAQMGGTADGTFTDEAFNAWGWHGFKWSEQRQIVPRWTIVEADGIAPNLRHLRMAIYALGGVLAVLRMPRSAMENTTRWDQPIHGSPEAADAGSHCVLLAGYDAGSFYAVSWGRVIPVAPIFITARLQQAHAFASSAWARAGVSPSGLTFADIQAIGPQVAGV